MTSSTLFRQPTLLFSLISGPVLFGVRIAKVLPAGMNLLVEEVEIGKMSRESLKFLTEYEVDRIQRLLAATDLSFQNIANRMDCAKSTVIAINRKYNIRSYGGRRTQWEVTNLSVLGKLTVETNNPGCQRMSPNFAKP